MRSKDNLRQLFLLKILYERTDEFHALSTNEIITILSEEYGITAHRITIKDDIISFQEFGIEVVEERRSQNYYRLISRTFSVPELKILIDAIQSAKFITANQSAELSKRIASLASCHELESLNRHITVEDRYKSQNVQSLYIVDAINTAINKEKKISFRYFSYSPTKRKVPRHGGEMYAFSPYYLVWNGDHYYTVGYSEKHKGIGSFRVDRFMEVPIIMDDAAVPMPKDFKVNDYITSMLHMYNSEHTTVELLCDNDVMDSIIDKFGTGIKTSRATKDSFKATVNVAVNHVFFAWVFGFYGKVRIVAPADVRKQYLQMLSDAVNANRS
jgi:predicted DNA-binding transcriptional regulator YafY